MYEVLKKDTLTLPRQSNRSPEIDRGVESSSAVVRPDGRRKDVHDRRITIRMAGVSSSIARIVLLYLPLQPFRVISKHEDVSVLRH